MSTNKTPNYQLHSWLPTDDFRFHEINENFTKLDQNLKRVDSSATRMVLGTYVGPGTYSTAHVELGFRPKAVFAVKSDGELNFNSSEFYLAFTRDGMTDCGLLIDATGFTVRTNGKSRMAFDNGKFNYFAVR